MLFFITSNFGAEDERSYFQLRLEPENVLNMFLKLCGILINYINLKKVPYYLS